MVTDRLALATKDTAASSDCLSFHFPNQLAFLFEVKQNKDGPGFAILPSHTPFRESLASHNVKCH